MWLPQSRLKGSPGTACRGTKRTASSLCPAVTWAWVVYVPLCSSRKSSPTHVHSCDDSFSRTEKSRSGVDIWTLGEGGTDSDRSGGKHTSS